MSTTIIVLLTTWLGLNAAFVAMRLYVTGEPRSPTGPDVVPVFLNN